MPVEPVQLNEDGTVTVTHGAESGVCTPQILHIGSEVRVLLECPACGATSSWPTSGGATPSLADLLARIVGR